MPFLSFERGFVLFVCFAAFLLFPAAAFSNENYKKSETGFLYNNEPSLIIAASATDICRNNTVTFLATALNVGPNPAYLWKKNGVAAGTNAASYTSTFTVNDVIVCSVTFTAANGTQTITSNIIVMQGINDVVPEVTVVASQQTICAGSTVTFTATNKSFSSSPSYQWKVNGLNVGTNSTVYSSSSLTNGSIVECMMTVPQCSGGTTKDYSDPITISVTNTLNPVISITASAATICKGNPVTFTAVATQSGTNPTFQWKVNGTNTGINKNTFTANSLSDADKVSCVITPDQNNSCTAVPVAISNIITVKVNDVITPTITISASQTEICAGTPVVFSAKTENAGTNPIYQWQVNSKNEGTSVPTFSFSNLKNGDQINCLLSSNNLCNTTPSLSNTIIVIVKDIPAITFTPEKLTVPAGNSAQLHAAVTGTLDSFAWSPANKLMDPKSLAPFTTTLENAITYQLSVYGINGCTATKSIDVAVIRNLYMPNSFTPNGDGLNDVFRIPPGVSLQLKQFQIFDRWGNKIFSTTDINKGWDGSYKSKQLDSNNFIYLVEGTVANKAILLKGPVILLR
jgi:gliding motility-associated-like protein